METPLAGAKHGGYTGYPMFNAPDALAVSLRAAGFDLVITAHNHCLDRGVAGLQRTLEVLRQQPPAPGAVPRRLAGLLRFPQGEVQRVPLLLPHLDAGAGLQVVQSLPAQGAVLRPASDVEVDVAACYSDRKSVV